MLFPSEVFLFLFLPFVVGVYYLFLRKTKILKNVFLFLMSLFFYAWGEPKYVYLMLAVIICNHLFGIWIDSFREMKWLANTILVIMLAVNLGILCYFKYTNFLLSNINSMFGTQFPALNIVLPIGISFFIFQAISYVIDVYRKNGTVQKNPLNVGFYIAFFPQLIAGPIVRYETIASQINERFENSSDFSKGVNRFIIGLGKKVLIANNMGVVADSSFSLMSGGIYQGSWLMAWIGAISYTLQIFFDFSGYSDMAIGLGNMFGFHFEENFNYPYISKSISEFWRRWHISLQTWFRDYVYFPLGGSRVETKYRLIFNLFIVWMLTGFWHGANWTFVFWGLLYFILLTIEKLTGFDKKLGFLGHIYTMFFVMIGWVIFRSNSLTESFIYIKKMFDIKIRNFSDPGAIQYLTQYKWIYMFAFLCATPLLKKIDERMKKYIWWNAFYILFIIAIFVFSVSYIFNNSYNPFIYFNF